MGTQTIIMLALIGVVRFKPSKKKIWLMATPKTEAKAKMSKSLVFGFSLGVNIETSQKTKVAPTTRNKMIARGCKKSGIIPFATTKFSP